MVINDDINLLQLYNLVSTNALIKYISFSIVPDPTFILKYINVLKALLVLRII